MLVRELQEEVANHLGDAAMEFVLSHQLLTFINSGARDLINSGWLLPIEHAEGVELLSNEYEYDVPANFAYLNDIRIGSRTSDNASTVDTGTLTDGAISSTSTTSVTVDDGTIFVVNNVFQVDDEKFLITAISGNVLTVERGHFSTTAATHLDDANILRPFSNINYDYVIPKPYWRLKLDTGGANTTTAAKGSRAQVVFESSYFSFTGGTPMQFTGQKRPSVYTVGTETLDFHVESFLRERALSYASRYAVARGRSGLREIAQTARFTSEQFLARHPFEFRVAPSSVRVPGG